MSRHGLSLMIKCMCMLSPVQKTVFRDMPIPPTPPNTHTHTHTHSDYASYFNLIPINVGESQSLFWSGTQDLVSLISCMTESGVNVVSSSNTPSAGIINSFYDNDTNWCGRMGGIYTCIYRVSMCCGVSIKCF